MGKFKPTVFYKEVRDELDNVNWPTKENTLNTSLVVLVVVSIVTVYLGIVDLLASKLTQLIIG